MKKPSLYDHIATIYLVRHGDTDMNSGAENTERFRAWGDPPLNEKGMAAAHTAGRYLADKNIAHIFASDLGRTEHTADIISQYTGADVTPYHGLRPWNLGEFTGQPVEPNKSTVENYQKHPDEPIPGGESYNDFLHRWKQTFGHAVQVAQHVGRPIALVTHTRNINALEFEVKNKPTKVDSMLPPGGILRADVHAGKIHLKDLDPEAGIKEEPLHFEE